MPVYGTSVSLHVDNADLCNDQHKSADRPAPLTLSSCGSLGTIMIIISISEAEHTEFNSIYAGHSIGWDKRRMWLSLNV